MIDTREGHLDIASYCVKRHLDIASYGDKRLLGMVDDSLTLISSATTSDRGRR